MNTAERGLEMPLERCSICGNAGAHYNERIVTIDGKPRLIRRCSAICDKCLQAENTRYDRKKAALKSERTRIARIMREIYPGIDPQDIEEIVAHAWDDDSYRVGKARLPREKKVVLAVRAWIRHTKTAYDELHIGGSDDDTHAIARTTVEATVNQIEELYREEASK